MNKLKQKLVNYLLRDAHIDELHIGAHSIVVTGDVIKMNPLATDPTTPAEGWIWHLAGTTHLLKFHDGVSIKDIGEGTAPGAHALAGAQHNADTLANLNAKISDATLDDSSAARTPASHDNTQHSDINQSLLTTDNVAFAQVTIGDLVMKNGYRFTEHKKYGIVLKSPEGKTYRMLLKEC